MVNVNNTKNITNDSCNLLDNYYVAGIYAQCFICINAFIPYNTQYGRHIITSNLQTRKLRFRDIKILTMVTQLIHETAISSQVSLTSELMYAPSTGYHVLLSHQLFTRFTFIRLFCNFSVTKKKKVMGEKEYSYVYLCTRFSSIHS